MNRYPKSKQHNAKVQCSKKGRERMCESPSPLSAVSITKQILVKKSKGNSRYCKRRSIYTQGPRVNIISKGTPKFEGTVNISGKEYIFSFTREHVNEAYGAAIARW